MTLELPEEEVIIAKEYGARVILRAIATELNLDVEIPKHGTIQNSDLARVYLAITEGGDAGDE